LYKYLIAADTSKVIKTTNAVITADPII